MKSCIKWRNINTMEWLKVKPCHWFVKENWMDEGYTSFENSIHNALHVFHEINSLEASIHQQTQQIFNDLETTTTPLVESLLEFLSSSESHLTKVFSFNVFILDSLLDIVHYFHYFHLTNSMFSAFDAITFFLNFRNIHYYHFHQDFLGWNVQFEWCEISGGVGVSAVEEQRQRAQPTGQQDLRPAQRPQKRLQQVILSCCSCFQRPNHRQVVKY